MTTVIDRSFAVREAARVLASYSADRRNAVLLRFADELQQNSELILSANERDVAAGRERGMTAALIDRLTVDSMRLIGIADAVRDVAALDDPLGEVVEQSTLENGLKLQKVRVPFGVVCVVYEARPNVTADAASIAIKTGNGAILRGSTAAHETNTAIFSCLHQAMVEEGMPTDAIDLFDPRDRDGFKELISREGTVDLVIPRGGEELKKFLYEHARVPILAAAGGNCHVYIDESADAEMATAIVVNAKTHRPGVCNAAETLLVHKSRSNDLLPILRAALENAGVEIVEGEEALGTEFLDLKIAIAEVESVEDAVAHINRYGTKHSEAIVTNDDESAETFVNGIDAACIYVNASTRFTDGGVFGMGAEVGISTNKLHARGPIGLKELTTYKYVVRGTGQIRS